MDMIDGVTLDQLRTFIAAVAPAEHSVRDSRQSLAHAGKEPRRGLGVGRRKLLSRGAQAAPRAIRGKPDA